MSHTTLQPKRATSAFSFEIPATSMAKPEACGQIVLPDKLLLIGSKLVENAKIENSDETLWAIFKQPKEFELIPKKLFKNHLKMSH